MPYRLKGTLKLPSTSQPAAGVDIEFISRRNYSPLLMDLSSIIKTSPTGAYDVTLEYGEYAVVLYWGCNQPSHIGKLFVFADTAAGLDLQTLLQQSDWQPATPEYVQQIQGWLAESQDAANRAENAAMSMTGALLDGGQCDLSRGVYPPPLTVGGKNYSTVWYVQVGGTVGAITYDVGDVLRYTTADNSYFKIDAVDTATAQINAHKVDPSAHAISTITGLSDALDSKYGRSDGTITKIITMQAPAGASVGLYYPIVFSGEKDLTQLDLSIDTNSGDISMPMNNCSFRGTIRSGGWSDVTSIVDGVFTIFSSQERAIMSVWGSAEGVGVFAVYVDGGGFPVTVCHNSGVSVQTSSNNISVNECVFYSGVENPAGVKIKELSNFSKGTGRYYNNKLISNQTASDVGADPVGTAEALVNKLKNDPNPFPQYSDFVSGEPRMFESRKQLDKRADQYHPLDGQLVPRSSDAGLLAAIVSGEVPSCSDAEWLADPKKRSNYTLGDGSTNIRLPDRNGKVPGTIGSVFARGDGDNAPASGEIHNDTIRNFTGEISPNVDGADGRWVGMSQGHGVLKRRMTSTPAKNLSSAGVDSVTAGGIIIDASLQVPTGPQNRPVSISQVWSVKR